MIQECVTRLLESRYAGLDDVVSGEELTDAALQKGFNLIGYHNTNNPNLTVFYNRSAGIHFGSLKAANDRGEMRDWDDEGDNWTNKYFLKAQNPLVIEKDFDWEMESFDDWSSPDDDKYYDDINIFAYFENELGWETMVYDENGNPKYGKNIKEIINEHGYDCIIYKNEREDVGNYSIAMFNPNNIKLATETTDDNGQLIPINQRFNTAINDVRY
jgi:hypothetical protein